MARYLTHQEANDAGYSFEHQPEENRFVVTLDGKEIGFARYTKSEPQTVDFDGTHVTPSQRGTGVSSLLVQTAVGSPEFENHNVKASCWYVEEVLTKHPEYLASGATF